MNLLVGTSGYSYKEWKGVFYPEDIKPDGMLSFYASKLPAVEINNTFYRMPKTSVVQTWADQVPAPFRFSIKASRRITHLKRLKEVGEETGYLFSALESLGDRLGVVLVQLPPNFKKDLERLETFMELLPAGARTVFEFRHPSWLDEDAVSCLREHSCALCVSDTDEEPLTELVATAPWGYLRLRRADYDDGALAEWAKRIAQQPWEDVFVFFKHEDGGAGPRMAEQFLEIAGS